MVEIFLRFFSLGFVSFGGPAAHIGYFRKYFVEKHRWLDDSSYAGLVALSQFLPGPGSSQVGFAVGMRRAGVLGGMSAFIGFTLPSFLLMYLLATSLLLQQPSAVTDGIIHALKLLAVVVVADAAYGMFSNFCQQRWSACVAVVTAAVLLLIPGIASQMIILLLAALIGSQAGYDPAPASPASVVRPRKGAAILFLICGLVPLAFSQPLLELFQAFYTSGSLVFGGGHVVLPLLQELVGDSIDTDRFLLGYSAAQAVPGPMFTLASFLGAEMWQQSPFLGALLATLAIFLPGFLLLIAFHDSWVSLNQKPRIAAAIKGVNAAVVGLLISALYQPVFATAVSSAQDFAIVLLGLLLLRGLKLNILLLVSLFIAYGAGNYFYGV
nr:chromate efflux transporter [Marinobacterium jannaschii]